MPGRVVSERWVLIQLFVIGWGENIVVQKCILRIDPQIQLQRSKVGIIGSQEWEIRCVVIADVIRVGITQQFGHESQGIQPDQKPKGNVGALEAFETLQPLVVNGVKVKHVEHGDAVVSARFLIGPQN